MCGQYNVSNWNYSQAYDPTYIWWLNKGEDEKEWTYGTRIAFIPKTIKGEKVTIKVLKVLKNPSLIISLSPIIRAEINSKEVINIQAINKNTITPAIILNSFFFISNSSATLILF